MCMTAGGINDAKTSINFRNHLVLLGEFLVYI